MGTISEKLTYLNTTKQKLKDSINALGGDITSETTFRNYVTELDNIYSSLPKTTGEGSNLSLSPTLKGKLNIEAYKGDTEQEGTPTPSSSQDINVVTGQQEVVVQNRNLLAGIEYGEIIAQTGAEVSSTSAVRSTNFIPYQLDTKYYASVNGAELSSGINLRFYNKDKEYIGYTSSTLKGAMNLNFVIATSVADTTPKYIKFRCALNTGVITSVDDKVLISTTNDYSYIAHQEQTKTLHLEDIELAKIGTYQDRIFETSGKNLFDKDNAQILNAFVNGSSGLLATPTNNQKSIAVAIQPNTQYTISGVERSSSNYGLFSDETLTIGTSTATTKGNINNGTMTFTSGANDKWLVFLLGGGSETYGYSKVMLNEGSTALPYEPYGSDKWYIEKNIGKRTYTSNEIVQVNGLSYTNLTYFSIPKSNDSIDYNNFAVSSALFDKYLIQNVVNWDSTNNIGRISNRANALTYWIGVPLGTNIETYRTQVGEIINYYILATPTYTEITNTTLIEELNELEKMMSYNGTTNISVTGSLPMILDVSALKGE